MKLKFDEAQIEAINAARKKNQNKKIDRRLLVLEMRIEGRSQKEMQAATGFSKSYINSIIKRYREEGLSSVGESHYKGNRRNLTFEEEASLLEPFMARAQAGQMVEVSEIKAAYMERVGHSIGTAQIYYVLKRHGWRKVMPRPKHPKAASQEEQDSSKKLKE